MGKVLHVDCRNCENRHRSVFCNISEKMLDWVNHSKSINTYKKTQVIFHQGNPPFGLYFIHSGKVKVAKIGSDGKESIIRIAGPGDILGHRSLFSKENYTATATALEETEVCFVDKENIMAVLERDPNLAVNLIEKLSKEMGAAETRSASMFQKNVSERLADFFIFLMNNYGVEENGRCRLDISLKREEIASMVGTTNETVIRFISEFKEEGIIEQEGKVIFVIDKNKLKEYANQNY